MRFRSDPVDPSDWRVSVVCSLWDVDSLNIFFFCLHFLCICSLTARRCTVIFRDPDPDVFVQRRGRLRPHLRGMCVAVMRTLSCWVMVAGAPGSTFTLPNLILTRTVLFGPSIINPRIVVEMCVLLGTPVLGTLGMESSVSFANNRVWPIFKALYYLRCGNIQGSGLLKACLCLEFTDNSTFTDVIS